MLQRWTETYARWSPQGTYFTTFHEKGIALWGGENFKQIMRFSHHGVQLIDFSPCEKCVHFFVCFVTEIGVELCHFCNCVWCSTERNAAGTV